MSCYDLRLLQLSVTPLLRCGCRKHFREGYTGVSRFIAPPTSLLEMHFRNWGCPSRWSTKIDFRVTSRRSEETQKSGNETQPKSPTTWCVVWDLKTNTLSVMMSSCFCSFLFLVEGKQAKQTNRTEKQTQHHTFILWSALSASLFPTSYQVSSLMCYICQGVYRKAFTSPLGLGCIAGRNST